MLHVGCVFVISFLFSLFLSLNAFPGSIELSGALGAIAPKVVVVVQTLPSGVEVITTITIVTIVTIVIVVIVVVVVSVEEFLIALDVSGCHEGAPPPLVAVRALTKVGIGPHHVGLTGVVQIAGDPQQRRTPHCGLLVDAPLNAHSRV